MLVSSVLETPDGSEFSIHPDFRTVASFFLGWVFLTAMASISSSPLVQTIFRTIFRHFSGRVNHQIPTVLLDKKTIDSASEADFDTIHHGDSFILLFIMFICFATGSIANFASLLSFGGNGALCAFAVAWGIIATQAARLMGLLSLLLTLRHLGMSRWESITFLFWLLVGLVFIFVNGALAVGVIRHEPLEISLCYRSHFLPASLVTTLIYVALEIFVIARLWFLLPPGVPPCSRVAILDSRVLRAGSLLVLDLLIMVPSATNTNTLAEFIPYSIGSVTVLIAFNRRVDDWEVTNRASTPPVHPVSNFLSSPLSALHLPRPVVESTLPVTSYPTLPPLINHHPFSARSLEDQTTLRDEWEHHPRTARSSKTIDSVYARSIQGAVVQIARRAKPPDLILDFAPLPGSSHRSVAVKSVPVDIDCTMETVHAPDSDAASSNSHPTKPARPKLMIVTHSPDGWPSRPTMTKRDLTGLVSQRVANEPQCTPEVTNPGLTRSGVRSFSSPTMNSPDTVSYPAVIKARAPSADYSHRTSVSSTRQDPNESLRSANLETWELAKDAPKLWIARSPPNSVPLIRPIAPPAGPRSLEHRRVRLEGESE